ncbi:hypothetical protein [Streptosporangium sp. NPDC002721]|uniref:hypothetical protein n=1 Tax=Streptosporangium sp. NPDC002721 TaxID=3366188 RepID=UPI0036A1848F
MIPAPRGLWATSFTLDDHGSAWRFLLNSTIVTGNVLTCSLAACAFARLRFRLRTPCSPSCRPRSCCPSTWC